MSDDLPIMSKLCGNRDFRQFCSCDLDLDLITFIYELHPYSLKIFRSAKINFLHRGFQSYCITNIQTQLELYTMLLVCCQLP